MFRRRAKENPANQTGEFCRAGFPAPYGATSLGPPKETPSAVPCSVTSIRSHCRPIWTLRSAKKSGWGNDANARAPAAWWRKSRRFIGCRRQFLIQTAHSGDSMAVERKRIQMGCSPPPSLAKAQVNLVTPGIADEGRHHDRRCSRMCVCPSLADANCGNSCYRNGPAQGC